MKHGAPLFLLVAACSAPAGPAPSRGANPPAVSTSAPEPAADAPQKPVAHDDPKCAGPPNVDAIEIAAGATARTDERLAITYRGLEHDNFEGGRTDQVVELTFQGILDDGKLTPSALTWRPSVMGTPSWAHLGSMPICVRVSKPGPDRVTVEVFRRPGR